MRLRRYGIQPFVPDGPQYHFDVDRRHRYFTHWGAKREAKAMNYMVATRGYKLRYKIVKIKD